MIDIKELRKGNLVRCLSHLPIGYHPSYLPITEIFEIKEGYVETSGGSHRYRDIAPVPLTEEILLEAGGVASENNTILFTEEEAPFSLSFQKDIDKFYLLVNGERHSVGIDSVHYFQNVYFFLKGKDIDMKLKV